MSGNSDLRGELAALQEVFLLIAAAPALYAALDECEAFLSIIPPRSNMAECLQLLAKVRAALSAARGEPHKGV